MIAGQVWVDHRKVDGVKKPSITIEWKSRQELHGLTLIVFHILNYLKLLIIYSIVDKLLIFQTLILSSITLVYQLSFQTPKHSRLMLLEDDTVE